MNKKVLAFSVAILTVSSLAGCNKTGSNVVTGTTGTSATEWTGDNVSVKELEEEETLDVDIKGQTLKWMGFYDINPTNDSPDRSPELSLFEDTYGAKIEYIPTTNDKRFEDLATAILAGDPPDIFYCESSTFPFDISQGKYQPIDSLIDWEDPKWADVKDIADGFLYNGEHYIAPLGYSFNETQILMYNRTTVENEGFDDPYQLYLDGKWDWATCLEMMKGFADGGEDRYGIGGWWANAFIYTSGDIMVKYDGEKFTNNLRSPAIERAQELIYDITRNELVKGGWIGPESAFVDDSLLFYSMGAWAYDGAANTRADDVIQIVPYPKSPDSEKYVAPYKYYAHMWVKGSTNADCVKAWFNCNRIVNYEETYLQALKDKFLQNNTNWTSDMYDIVTDFYDRDNFQQAYDYGYGLSAQAGDDIMPTLYDGIVNGVFESWTQARESYYTIMDEEIARYN